MSAGKDRATSIAESDSLAPGVRSIAVVNAGGWGTALAVMLANAGYAIRLWARRPELAMAITSERENHDYLPYVVVPPTIAVTSDLEAAVCDADVVIVAVIASYMREISEKLSRLIRDDALVVHGTKGLERGTWLRLSTVLGEAVGMRRVAVLAGPNHAEEVARGLPTAAVLGCVDEAVGSRLQEVLASPRFRVYTNSDVAGIELCSAAKNVIAIAAGIGDGLGYGDNSKAALITRSLAEIWRLVERHGGSFATVAGLAGVGDVIATCTSHHSRNRWAGEQIGRGRALDEIVASTPMVIEGIPATEGIRFLASEAKVEMPICEGVYRVIFEGQQLDAAQRELLARDWASEG